MESITSRDDTALSYSIDGEGPPLLLVHGTTADHTRWAGILPRLTESFTTYAIDRRGRGESGDSADYDLQREAEDVAAVVDAIGEPVRILGHSYGAVCALEAALLTDQIERMVLYEPPIPTDEPMYPPGVPDRMRSLIDDRQPESALLLFFREVVRMPDSELEDYRQLPMWERRLELVSTIPRELAIDRAYRFQPSRFAELDVATLFLLGGDSPALFQKAVEAGHAAVPNSHVVVLPGQQHIAMDTNPTLFLGEVFRFLRD